MAEIIADMLGNNGARFETEAGASIHTLCSDAELRMCLDKYGRHDEHCWVYAFSDGSGIIVMSCGWDAIRQTEREGVWSCLADPSMLYYEDDRQAWADPEWAD